MFDRSVQCATGGVLWTMEHAAQLKNRCRVGPLAPARREAATGLPKRSGQESLRSGPLKLNLQWNFASMWIPLRHTATVPHSPVTKPPIMSRRMRHTKQTSKSPALLHTAWVPGSLELKEEILHTTKTRIENLDQRTDKQEGDEIGACSSCGLT